MKLCLLFYKHFCSSTLLVTVICVALLWESKNPYFITVTFAGKAMTSVVIALYLLYFESSYFVFYRNLGFSKQRLMTLTFGFDFLIWLVASITTAQLLAA